MLTKQFRFILSAAAVLVIAALFFLGYLSLVKEIRSSREGLATFQVVAPAEPEVSVTPVVSPTPTKPVKKVLELKEGSTGATIILPNGVTVTK